MPEIITKIFDPDLSQEPMRIVGFGSGSGTNLEAIIKAQKVFEEKARNGEIESVPYRMVAIFTNVPESNCPNLAEEYDIPLVSCSDEAFNIRKNGSIKKDPELRYKYFTEVAQQIRPFGPDLIVLGGFMLLVTEPLLSEYKDKIINVHPANLSILDEDGKRKYLGENAVYDAIKDRAVQTRSTIHIVDKEVDHGEILVMSRALTVPVTVGMMSTDKKLQESADHHQDEQKKHCDWPAYIAAVEMIAQGRLAIGSERNEFGLRTVYVDERAMPYGGYRLG